MTQTTDYSDYKAELGGLPESRFIGTMLYFEFNQPQVTHADLEQFFILRGLDTRHLPPPIKPVEAFKRSTGTEAKWRYDHSDGQRREWMVRPVDTDADRVIRHIICERRDAKGRKLDYEKVGTATFYRQTQPNGGSSVRFVIEPIADSEVEAETSKFITSMSEKFDFFKDHYYTQAIRDMVRKYVEGLNAVPCRRGGAIYFVPRSRWGEVHKLMDLVNEDIGSGCRIHTMPLLDTEHQRNMLSQAHQDDVERTATKLMEDIANINDSGGTIKRATYDKLMDRYSQIESSAVEYTGIFKQSQERAASSLGLALQALLAMTRNVERA